MQALNCEGEPIFQKSDNQTLITRNMQSHRTKTTRTEQNGEINDIFSLINHRDQLLPCI